MDENLTRKEKERIFRRNEILSASAIHFARKGFAKTTLDEISESAEFGKGTIYNYFANKEEIYKTILEDMLEGNLHLLEESVNKGEEIEQFLANYTSSLFQFCLSKKDSFKLIIKELAQMENETEQIDRTHLREIMNKMHVILENVFKDACDAGKIAGYSPEELTLYYNHFVYPTLSALIHCPVRYGIDEEQPNRVLNVFLRGILNVTNGANN